MKKAALVLLCVVAAGAFATSALATKPAGAQCWTSSSQLALGDSYWVSASGLPTNGQLNLVVVYPNGNMLTSPFTPSDSGLFSVQSTSGMVGQATQVVRIGRDRDVRRAAGTVGGEGNGAIASDAELAAGIGPVEPAAADSVGERRYAAVEADA